MPQMVRVGTTSPELLGRDLSFVINCIETMLGHTEFESPLAKLPAERGRIRSLARAISGYGVLQ